MALKKCKECGHKVSTKAAACPNCGAKPPKKTSLFTWIVTILTCAIVYIVITSPPSSIPNKPKPTPEELAAEQAEKKKDAERQERLKAHRDQEHREQVFITRAKKAVANSRRDPESVKFKSVFYNYTKEAGHMVCGQANYKNVYGGYKGFQYFISNTKLVFFQQDTKDFADVWNKFCLPDK